MTASRFRFVNAAQHETRARRPIFDKAFFVLLAITLASGAAVFATDGGDVLGATIAETVFFIVELLPKIVAGIFIAAALPVLIPREKIANWIGHDSGLRGLILASLAGVILPGGPSMIMPLTAGFLTAGADLGAATAFIAGWSLLSLNRTIIWEYSFLPAHLVTFRLLVCTPFPVLAGLLLRGLLRRRAR